MDDVGSHRSFALVKLSINTALFLIKKDIKIESQIEVFRYKNRPTAQLEGKKGALIRRKENIKKQLFGED